jgi:hypothetical protein
MNSQLDFDSAVEKWLLQYRYTGDSQVLAKIAQRVRALLEQNGGYVSAAHFERAYLGLVNEGIIRPFKDPLNTHTAAAPAIPPDVVAWIENPRVSSFEQRKRYSQDLVFKRYYDLYANQQLKAKVAAEENEESLTVEQYNSMRAVDVAKKYRASAAFKRGVDKLVAEGKI